MAFELNMELHLAHALAESQTIGIDYVVKDRRGASATGRINVHYRVCPKGLACSPRALSVLCVYRFMATIQLVASVRNACCQLSPPCHLTSLPPPLPPLLVPRARL